MLIAIVDRYAYENNDKKVRKSISMITEEVHRKDSSIQFKHLYEDENTLSKLKDYEAVFLYSHLSPFELYQQIEELTGEDNFYIHVDESSNQKYYKSILMLLDYYFEEEKK